MSRAAAWPLSPCDCDESLDEVVGRVHCQRLVLQTIPGTLIAGPLHFTIREFFEAERGVEAPVSVQF